MVALAIWLLVLDPTRAAHLAFAGFLTFRAAEICLVVLTLMAASAGDQSTAAFLIRLVPYFAIAVIPFVVYFASVYPVRRGPLGAPGWGLAAVFATIMVLDAVVLMYPSLYWTLTPEFEVETAGPLYFFTSGKALVFGLVALLFATDYRRKNPGSPRYSAMLVMVGLSLNALYDATLGVVAMANVVLRAPGFDWLPWNWLLLVPPLVAFVPLVGVALIMAGAARAARTASATTGEVKRFLWAMPLPVLSALAVSVPIVAPMLPDYAHDFLAGVWRLSLPVLATYALVRYQLFDIDFKVRSAIHYGFVVMAFALVFVLVSESIEGVVADRYGDIIGLTAAALLAFALRPLERLGERIAQHLMPHTLPFDRLDADQRSTLFAEQLALALQDGHVTPKEREMLNRLRDRLGLTASTAQSLESKWASQA